MKKFLYIVAVGEAATGLLLLIRPIAVRVLFAAEPIGVGVIMTRIAGICLIALGVGCWPSDNLRQPLCGMLTYSTLVMLYLIIVGLGEPTSGFLWAAVGLHAVVSALLLRAVSAQQTPGAKGTASSR